MPIPLLGRGGKLVNIFPKNSHNLHSASTIVLEYKKIRTRVGMLVDW